jgi:hypothetical protein
VAEIYYETGIVSIGKIASGEAKTDSKGKQHTSLARNGEIEAFVVARLDIFS